MHVARVNLYLIRLDARDACTMWGWEYFVEMGCWGNSDVGV